MATQVVTDPVLLDSTGQDIVDGLEGIKNAVQPINIYQDVEISIPLDGWSQSVPYRYTWLYQRITTECGVEVHFIDGAEDVDMRYLEYEKVPGGIRFEIDQLPDKAIPVMVRIINATTTAVIDPLDATLVTQDAVPQTSNVQEGLANHESRLAGAEEDIDDIEAKLGEVDDELALRLKSVNSIGPDENGDVVVNETEFAHQIVTDDAQQSTGEFLFRTTGGDASLSDGPAMLVSISGRSIHTGEVAESLEMTVSMATRTEEQDIIEAEIDRDTFVEEVSSSGTVTLFYTTDWSEDPADYGVTVTGTPMTGDSITIVYVKASRGLITNSNPSKFTSTGWNLYDNTTGKKYAKVKKYSTEYGFLIGGAYSTLQFSETLSGSKSSLTPVSGYFTVPSDGYVWVTGGDDTTYIMMTWSDWTEGYEGDFETYSETSIDLANLAIKLGTSAATTFGTAFPNGLMQVGAVHDEINFSMMRVISRIERMTYSAANLETAEASGRAFDADESYIYLVKEFEDVYVITATTGAYTASDHGNEIIEGGDVPVFVSTLYGRNLVDYLRQDVPSAISELNDKIKSTVISSNTLENIEAELVTIGNSLSGNGDAKNIRFAVSVASGLFEANDYVGTIRRRGLSRFIVNVWNSESEDIIGYYKGTWSWSSLNSKIEKKLNFNAVGSLNSSSSVSFTVLDGTYGILALVGTSQGRCGLYLFRTSSTSVYVIPIHNSDVSGSITVATSGKTVNLTSDSASGSAVYAMFFSGGLAD